MEERMHRDIMDDTMNNIDFKFNTKLLKKIGAKQEK